MSAKDIKKHQFTSENQPPKEKKSRKGIPNRSTLLKKWLKLKVNFSNWNEETGEKTFEELGENIKITLEDAITLGIIQKAQSGDVSAYREIQDTLHGKIADSLKIGNEDDKPFKTLIIQGVESDDGNK